MPVHGVTLNNGISDAAVASLRDDSIGRYKPLPKSILVQPLAEDGNWLIVDHTYPWQIAERLESLEKRPGWIMGRAPGHDTAAAEIELRDAVVDYMLTTYPDYFSRTDDTVTCNLTGIGIDVGPNGADPLIACLLLASEDLLIMMPGEADPKGIMQYPLAAGVLAFPNGWSLISHFDKPEPDPADEEAHKAWVEARDDSHFSARLGKTSREIHEKQVGLYREKYATGVDRFFSVLKPANEDGQPQIFERRNWTASLRDCMFRHADATGVWWTGGDITPDVWSDKWIRSEHETFRKLPQSGAVIFSIKTNRWPMMDVLDHPEAGPALHTAYANMMAHEPLMIEYKGPDVMEALGTFLRNPRPGPPPRITFVGQAAPTEALAS